MKLAIILVLAAVITVTFALPAIEDGPVKVKKIVVSCDRSRIHLIAMEFMS